VTVADEDDVALARRAALAGAAVGLRYFAALAQLPKEGKADGQGGRSTGKKASAGADDKKDAAPLPIRTSSAG